MNDRLILLAMLFCHLIDDYYLQGILATLKQKSWWQINAKDELYRYDYIIALIEHAFSWSFSIHIPVFWYYLSSGQFMNMQAIVCIIFINTVIHAIIDDQKANRHTINLIMDQTFHFLQIILTWFLYFYII